MENRAPGPLNAYSISIVARCQCRTRERGLVLKTVYKYIKQTYSAHFPLYLRCNVFSAVMASDKFLTVCLISSTHTYIYTHTLHTSTAQNSAGALTYNGSFDHGFYRSRFAIKDVIYIQIMNACPAFIRHAKTLQHSTHRHKHTHTHPDRCDCVRCPTAATTSGPQIKWESRSLRPAYESETHASVPCARRVHRNVLLYTRRASAAANYIIYMHV